MASVINTNVQSLNAQRNLSTSQSSLATSLQRLSSGLRINSAKDDAAGLAISDRFTTQIRGLNQAARNANDAISLSQTAEGALGELSTNLQRIRELAVQSANATNSASDRAALDLEVQQRLAEVERIATQTSFNGQKILDGTFGNAAFQVGANVGETISLDLTTSMRQGAIGAVSTATSVDLDTVITAGSAAVTGSAATYSFDPTNIVGTDYSGTTDTPATTGVLGVFTAGGLETGGSNPYTYTLTLDDGSNTVTITDTVLAGGTGTIATFAAAIDTVYTGTTDGETVNGFTINYGGEANVTDALTNGTLSFSRADGTNFDITEAFGGTGTPSAVTGFDNAGVLGAGGTYTTLDGDSVANSKTFTINDPDGLTTLAITVDADLTLDDGTALLAEITGNAGYAAAGFTAALVGGNIVLTDKTNATGSFSITGTDATLITDENVAGETAAGVADTAAVPATSVTVADDFSIQIGTASAVAVANGSYSSAQDLVDAINTALGGSATAELDSNNVMTIVSSETITITGATGLATITSGTGGVNTASGSLNTVNVLDVSASNDAIRRIDSALSSVSDLRSTFGAIQNRFESTITNLATAVENLSAARSRIQDADFAAETANLTRAQILQQAGTAMLAQANALPQSVLSLLG